MCVVNSNLIVSKLPADFVDFLILIQVENDFEEILSEASKLSTTMTHPFFKDQNWLHLLTNTDTPMPLYPFLRFTNLENKKDEFIFDFCSACFEENSEETVRLFFDFISDYTDELFLGYVLESEAFENDTGIRKKYYNLKKYPHII